MAFIEEIEKTLPQPVMPGNVFATVLQELISLVQEVEARRNFCDDVTRWLKETGCTHAFETWRRAGSD